MVLIYQHQYLTQEEKRLKEDRELTLYWKHWSPYVAETMGYWFVLFLNYSSLFWMSFGDLFFFFVVVVVVDFCKTSIPLSYVLVPEQTTAVQRR